MAKLNLCTDGVISSFIQGIDLQCID
jgi:hypothetical protein